MLGLEPGYNIIECGVVGEIESIPKCPFGSTILVFRSGNRFRKPEEWKGKVDKSVLELLERLFAIDYL